MQHDNAYTKSSHISDCSTCGSNWTSADSRLRHLEDAMYSYERVKGQGAFSKDHPKLMDQINAHHHEKADMHIKHAKHIVEALAPKES